MRLYEHELRITRSYTTVILHSELIGVICVSMKHMRDIRVRSFSTTGV